MSKKNMVYSWVSGDVKELMEKIAKSMGITVSEYIRRLILEDLDKRNVFTTKLKREIQNEG